MDTTKEQPQTTPATDKPAKKDNGISNNPQLSTLQQMVVIVEHKVRNLEKRKVRLHCSCEFSLPALHTLLRHTIRKQTTCFLQKRGHFH
jgi:hypothetical protein